MPGRRDCGRYRTSITRSTPAAWSSPTSCGGSSRSYPIVHSVGMRPWCRMTQTSSAAYTSELAEALAPDVLERFLRYVRIDTQSDRAHAQSPSTPGQLELGRLLVEELTAIGLADATQDANGFVTATLAGNVEGAPIIGLM